MKRIVKSILASLLACSCILPIVGCGGNSSDEGAAASQNDEVMFADFEGQRLEKPLCLISSYFGRVSKNTDAQYVHAGNGSVRIDPVGNGWMYFSTVSEAQGYDYTDFTHVESVSMEMYNPQSTAQSVTVGLVSNPSGLDTFNRAGGKEFTLQPGWNTLHYYVDASLVSVVADLSDIEGIYFIFDPLFQYEITETSPRYYLDSIRLRYMENEHQIDANAFTFEQNEVMDFEKFWQSNFYINEFAIDMKIVKPQEYGVSNASGSKALRMVMPGSGTGAWRYYFEMVGPYLKKSPLGSLTLEQFNNAYFCWDVYNAGDSVYNVVAIFERGDGKNEYKIATFPKIGQWTTFRVKLTDIEGAMTGWKDNVGNFALSVLDNQSVDRELLLDNFRIEFD